MYRGFIKKINALDGNSIGSADLRILNMRIKRDILTKATSEFKVIGIPNAASVGDVFGVYDDSGKTVYLGVINSLENGVINTDQIIGIFDDNWKYNDYLDNSIEGKIKGIIERDFSNSQDTFQASIFNKFDVTKTTSTVNNFEYSSSRSLNFMNFLTENYDKYWVLTSIDVKYNAVRPTITIGVPTYPVIKLGNNSHALRNFEILQQEQSTNKIKVYDSKGEVLRATYYASSNGISTDSSLVGRPSKIRTQIICSDDPLEDIVAANLSSQMYSHQINVDLVLNNKLYVFDDFNLGQQFDIYYSGEYYNSILTGYEINVSGEGKAETVRLIFGKVRFTLENRIYEIANNSVDANSKVENINGTIVSMETQIVQNSKEIVLRATKEEFYGQKIGGKNYIRDSVYKDGTTHWFGVNQSHIKVEQLEYPNYKVLTNTDRGTTNYIYGQYTTYDYDKSRGNVDMVVSFTAYLPSDGEIAASCFINNNGWNNIGGATIEGKAGWHEYSRAIRIYSATLSGNLIIAFHIPRNIQYMQLYHCQLEEGTKATEWKQGDTDFTEGIRLAETSIEENAEAIKLRATKTEAQGYANTAESNAKTAAQGYANTAESNAKTYSDAQLTVEAGKIQSSVTEQIENIQVGGRNYVRDSAFKYGTSKWLGINGTSIRTDDLTYPGRVLVNSNRGTQNYLYGNITSLIYYHNSGNQSVAISFMAYLPSDSNILIAFWISSNGWKSIGAKTIDGKAGWHQYETSANLYSDSVDGEVIMGFAIPASVEYMSLYHPQLEIGNKATSWKLGEEDITNEISINTTNISQTANNVDINAQAISKVNGEVSTMSTHFFVQADGAYVSKDGATDNATKITDTGVEIYAGGQKVAQATSSQFLTNGAGGLGIGKWTIHYGESEYELVFDMEG